MVTNSRHTIFWILTIGVLIGLTLPVLVQDGMFMDALLYTSVSHNLSQGIGTFWYPQFSMHNVAGLPSFHEQPPLVFGIQSVFFNIFGDSMYVERFYTFLCMCITAFLITRFWKEIFHHDRESEKYSWLPVILWITIPVCFWSYSNNMHENTMGIFTLCSAFLSYKSLKEEKKRYGLLLLAGLMIFLASFSKGLPGFFPLGFPFFYYLFFRSHSFSRILSDTIILLSIPAIIYAVLFLIPESSESLHTYFVKRALHRISDVPTVTNRFYILGRLLMELIPMSSLTFIILIVHKLKRPGNILTGNYRHVLFFLCVGLSAVAPLTLTKVQKGFYFVPALPFIALGFSLLILPSIIYLVNKIDVRTFRYKLVLGFSVMLLLTIITYTGMQVGKASRDSEMLNDVYVIGSIVPKGEVVSFSAEMWNEWSLQCYLIRYFNISLEGSPGRKYYMSGKNFKDEMLKGYKKIDLPTLQYDLYVKQ